MKLNAEQVDPMGGVSVWEAPARAGGEGSTDPQASPGGRRRASVDERGMPRGQRHSESRGYGGGCGGRMVRWKQT